MHIYDYISTLGFIKGIVSLILNDHTKMPMPGSKIYVIILDWLFSVVISLEKWLAHFTIRNRYRSFRRIKNFGTEKNNNIIQIIDRIKVSRVLLWILNAWRVIWNYTYNKEFMKCFFLGYLQQLWTCSFIPWYLVFHLYYILAWEHSAAKVTKVTPAVYPLHDFTGKLNFRY